MTVNKRKKNSRQRASHTHGWGAKKKRRGSGNRGGKGNAGSGKRADCKKPSFWKDLKYFGKFGFKIKGAKRDIRPVNLIYLEENLQKFLKEKKAVQENGLYNIDLEAIGFNKLMGDGRVSNKFKIKTQYASKKSVEKIKAAGGEVIVG